MSSLSKCGGRKWARGKVGHGRKGALKAAKVRHECPICAQEIRPCNMERHRQACERERDAVLAVTAATPEECATCGDTGKVRRPTATTTSDPLRTGPTAHFVGPCPDCHGGSGVVAGNLSDTDVLAEIARQWIRPAPEGGKEANDA